MGAALRALRAPRLRAGRYVAGLSLWLALACLHAPAQADAVDTLRSFVSEVKTGSAAFTQVVTAKEGARSKTSSGRFEFSRPDRFRFAYLKPYEQLIVGDGSKVWIHDPDLNQASSRRMADALGATPAALLTGASLDEAFVLSAEPSRDGLDWALARPRQKDGAFQSMRVGFQGPTLAVVEIVDAFGQRSVLRFTEFVANAAIAPERFRFVPPPGADVIEQ